MIVTFISQCEKKALARTRRVLDAFACRIGDNAWQTVITKDGLLAAKRLLRKTVTKNTAVSCYWVRGRHRIELLWIVGNRNKFNLMGAVPVNSTQKDVFMDVVTTKAKGDQCYANISLQLLAEHSFAVGYIAWQLFKRILNNDEHENLSCVAFLAGCLHDLGKLDPNFQDWVKKGKQKDPEEDGQHIDIKFTFEKYPRHNEISLLIFNLFEQYCEQLNFSQKAGLQHVIYWHHAKPFRKDNKFTGVLNVYKCLTNGKIDGLIKQVPVLLKKIDQIGKNYNGIDLLGRHIKWADKSVETVLEKFEYQFNGRNYPDFKIYKTDLTTDGGTDELSKEIRKNAQHNLLRACVISADRLISKLPAEDLIDYIVQQRLDELLDAQEIISDLSEHLAEASSVFPDSEQTRQQNHVAQQLADKRDIAVLAGPAGCGKTKIALQWAKLKKAKKIIWICPRVQICQGIFQELIETYLPNAKVEIFTGEFKYTNAWDKPTKEHDYFSGDVVVTTIDQVLGSVVTHTNVNSLLPFIDAHVVFDEYHEYIGMEIFNILFAELIENKKMCNDYHKNTLLVSATPHYLYLQNILGLHHDDVIDMPSPNQCLYKINFIDYDESRIEDNPFYNNYSNKTFVISNTAQTAQLGFVYNKEKENSILFHAKYKKSDKKYLFDEVYQSFRKNGSQKYDVLRSGPIVQASLNISCGHMLSEMTSPENTLQRLGRLNRFSENEGITILQIAVTEHVKKGSCKGTSAYFLNQLHSLQTTKVWYDFLQEQLGDKAVNLSTLYHLYKTFYTAGSESILLKIRQDMDKALKKSIDLLNKKVTEPTKVVKVKTKDRKVKISRNSLRGDSRFVQLAVLNVNDFNKPIFENYYAYQLPVDDSGEFDNLTESLSMIKDLGLIDFIVKKHGNIDTTHPVKGIPINKNTARCAVLENYARDAEYPLYLSYTEDDLDKVGGIGQRHEEAMYYAICDKQPIGLMSATKLLLIVKQERE